MKYNLNKKVKQFALHLTLNLQTTSNSKKKYENHHYSKQTTC